MKSQEWLKSGAEMFDGRVVVPHLISTLFLTVVLLVLRWIIARSIRRQEQIPREIRRRLLVQVRNGALWLFLAGLMAIWAAELRSLAVYFFAIAVATVIATKELIQCITGSIMRAAGGAFSIGDRVEIGDLRGDVIDMGLLTTTIMEIGPNELTHRLTGRAVIVPNSTFLNKPVVNESYTDEYVLHVFTIPAKVMDDWKQSEQDLLEAAREQSCQYIEEARSHFEKLSEREGLVLLSVDPYVTVNLCKPEELELVVRLAAPARRKGQIEQAILRQFLDLQAERIKKNSLSSSNAEQPVTS